MKASLAIQILPQVQSMEETCQIVDAIIEHIRQTGLTYSVGPFETTVEGDDLDALVELAGACLHLAADRGAPKIYSYIKLFYQPDGGLMSIEDKVGPHRQG